MAFQNFYLTDKGAALLAKAQIGGSLTYTRAVIGDGALGTLQPTSLTDVISKITELSINALDFSTPNVAGVQIQFTNKDIQNPFYWREIGLFAKGADGTEILYAYGNAGDKADYIPSYGTSPTEFIFLMDTAIGNAANVTAVISSDLIYATKQDITDIKSGAIVAAKAAAADSAATASDATHAVSADNAANAATAAGYTSDGSIASALSVQSAAVSSLAGTGRTTETVKGNADAIAALKTDAAFETAGGTATVITLTMATLTDGYAKTFIASINNGGAATTINSIPLYKAGTKSAPVLVAGKAYTVWYNTSGNCFFLKASAEGTATAADVLAGKTFSNDDDTGIIGTMANNGQEIITPGTANIIIPKGYHDGTGYVNGDANLIPANILSGKSIFGINGTAAEVPTVAPGNISIGYYSTGSIYSAVIQPLGKIFTLNVKGTVRFYVSYLATWSNEYFSGYLYKNGERAASIYGAGGCSAGGICYTDITVSAGDTLQCYSSTGNDATFYGSGIEIDGTGLVS